MRKIAASLALWTLVTSCGMPVEGSIELDEAAAVEQEIRYGDETAAHPAVGLLEIQVGNLGYLCSGTLIAADLVLTAAHCVEGATPQGTFFRVGASSAYGAGPTYGTRSFAMTPGYSAIGDVNVPDLAVVRLQGAVPGVSPLPLAQAVPSQGAGLLGVGFGQDETNGASGVKRSGTMVLEGRAQGSAALPGGGSYAPAILTVRPGPTSQLSCPGDSGGPLLDATGAVVGVASYLSFPQGTPPGQYCSSGVQGGYASVPDSLPLLQALMGALPASPAVPGACQVDDAAFLSAEGGCRDEETGLVWSRRLPKARQQGAVNRCRNLVESGYDDWRLPTANELRGMARNGGRSHLAGGSSSRLWSKSRDGEDGVTVKMSSGAKTRTARTAKRAVYCVR